MSPRISVAVEILDQDRASTPTVACSAMTTRSPPRSPTSKRTAIVPSSPIGALSRGIRVEALAASLRLLGVLSGEVARDVVLLVRDFPLLLIEVPLLRQPPQRPLFDERRVVPARTAWRYRPRSAARGRRPRPRETRGRG